MPFIMMKLVQAVCIFKHAIGLDSLLNILKAPATVEFCSSHTHLRTPPLTLFRQLYSVYNHH